MAESNVFKYNEQNVIIQKCENGNLKVYSSIECSNGVKVKVKEPLPKGSLVVFLREIDFAKFIMNHRDIGLRFKQKYGTKAIQDAAVALTVNNYPVGMNMVNSTMYHDSELDKYMVRITMSVR